jgi:septum site-determining protein MinD
MPLVEEAKRRLIPLSNDTQIFMELAPCPVVGITGSAGKTTTTANLGVGLALQGKKVVLIDTDIGLRNLDVVMGLENRIVYDLVDVVEGSCRVKQALIKDKRYDGLYLLPAAQTRDKSAVSPEQMEKLCLELKQEYDYVIIDCPAGIEQGFKNAIAGADRGFVVTTPEVSAVRDADRIIGLLEANDIPVTDRIQLGGTPAHHQPAASGHGAPRRHDDH